MTDDSKGGSNEPSMEEILASIRRIIAEDAEQDEASASGTPPPQRAEAPPVSPEAHWPEDREAQADPPPRPERTPLPEDEEEAPPLELTQLVNEDGSITDLSVGAGPAMPFVADDASDREEAREVERREEPRPLVQAHHEPEDGEDTAERLEDIEVEDAVLDDVAAAVPPVSESKLEAEAESEVRAWLDRNLPDIVERVVREEVERMLRRLKDG